MKMIREGGDFGGPALLLRRWDRFLGVRTSQNTIDIHTSSFQRNNFTVARYKKSSKRRPTYS